MSSARWKGSRNDIYYLMKAHFDAPGLQVFIAGLPYGERLVSELPATTEPISTYAFAAAALLTRFGSVNEVFFQQWLQSMPQQAEDIVALAATGGITVQAPAADNGGSTITTPRPDPGPLEPPPAAPGTWLIPELPPRTVTVGLPFTLPVRLSTRAPALEQRALALPATTDGSTLHLLLQAPGQQVLGAVTASWPLPPTQGSSALPPPTEQQATFTLLPLLPGQLQVTLAVFMDDQALGSLDLPLQAVAQVLRGRVEPAAAEPAPRCATLRVTTAPEGDGSTQRWSFALLPAAGAAAAADPRPIFGSTTNVPAGLVQQAAVLLQRELRLGATWPAHTRRQGLASLGRYLAHQVLPAVIQQALSSWGSRSANSALLLLLGPGTDLPWELLDLNGPLSERFQLTCWPLEAESQRPTTLPMGPLATVEGTALPAYWRAALQIPGAPSNGLGNMAEPASHLLLFGPDASSQPAGPTWSPVQMRRQRPVILLACPPDPMFPLGAQSHWLPWLLAGASALCAPRWPVPAEAAATFQQVWLHALWQGQSLGAATATARQQATDAGIHALSWVVYGDPDARPYRPDTGLGHVSLEPLGWDGVHPLAPGEQRWMRVSLRRQAPLEAPALLRSADTPLPEVHVVVQAAGLRVTPARVAMTRAPNGDLSTWLQVQVAALHSGFPDEAWMQLHLLAGDDLLHTLFVALPTRLAGGAP